MDHYHQVKSQDTKLPIGYIESSFMSVTNYGLSSKWSKPKWL